MKEAKFIVKSDLVPRGDQPKAIEELSDGIRKGFKYQTLLGITGSGKTATIAWTIEKVNKPTLVIAPNKSLAAQFASELKTLLPDNKVEYFVSYYDYYQPEAYVPSTDTYIEKDACINDEIDRLRHSATVSLLTRRDTVVVASVSALYALGSPRAYLDENIILKEGDEVDIHELAKKLVSLQYTRNDFDLKRTSFRIKGDTVDIFPSDATHVIRLELFGDTIEKIKELNLVTGETKPLTDQLIIFPASHYVADEEVIRKAILSIQEDLEKAVKNFEANGKYLEAQRIRLRTENDLEMIKELGYCKGIENYSRYLDGRKPGEPPYTLLDYFPSDFLVVLDESHVSVPQLHGQYEGDHSRKKTLVEYGFRLESALDNRPLKFEEFMEKVPQIIFVSATPSDYELKISQRVAELVVRPTGLVDPLVTVRGTKNQIEDLISEINKVKDAGQRALVTTLTKKMAEELTQYLQELSMSVRYIHSDIDTLERIEIMRDLRLGRIDVVVGVNLLREGLDLPEVELVVILDADKEGFLRSKTSIIQTIGRAARNVNGRVILYADKVSKAMEEAIKETNRRRKIQLDYNQKHDINPESIRKEVNDIFSQIQTATTGGKARRKSCGAKEEFNVSYFEVLDDMSALSRKSIEVDDLLRLAKRMKKAMEDASKELKFELAARLRDEYFELEREIRDILTMPKK